MTWVPATPSSPQPPSASSPRPRATAAASARPPLPSRLRREGYTVANSRLRWLSSVSGLEPRHAAEPDRAATGRPMMARREPAVPGDRRQQDEGREQRLAALRIRLQAAAQDVRTAEDWARCLQAAARLPAETWANVLLISAQRPGATLVKGYEAWRAVGRHVNRDEKGIEIFSGRAPADTQPPRPAGTASRAAAGATRTTSSYVWDLSQTSGQPLPARTPIRSPPAGVPPGLWEALCWLARREGFAVEREPGCPDDGTTLWTARRIRVPPGLAGGQAIWALAHQLGHVLLHDPTATVPGTTTTGCQGVRKAEADSVAFIICARYGVPVGHAFASPQTWAGTDPRAQPGATILAAGERITMAAARISRHLDHHLPASTTGLPAPARAGTAALTAAADAAVSSPERDPRIEGVLLDAGQFYTGQLASSWAPAYLDKRGITAAAMGEWHIGYAPGGWTALTELPPRPRPPRRRDPGRRAGPCLIPRNAHRSLPGPGHAAGPRRARNPRRVHRPRPPRSRSRHTEISERTGDQHIPQR